MKNCLKLELQRLFHQKQLYIALGIGLAIAMLDVAQNIRDVASLSAMYPEAGFEGYSLFARWMGINGFTFGHVLFYLVWPALAAVPYGWTYLSDKRSGYWQQLVTR